MMRQHVLIVFSLAAASCNPVSEISTRPIRIVGSSTIYPFASVVSERFSHRHPGFPHVVIESTGTVAGMSLFCAGTGFRFPDILAAARPIDDSERRLCQQNGVSEIWGFQLGFDG